MEYEIVSLGSVTPGDRVIAYGDNIGTIIMIRRYKGKYKYQVMWDVCKPNQSNPHIHIYCGRTIKRLIERKPIGFSDGI